VRKAGSPPSLTLRLPADLARALSRWARTRGLAKSQVVRDAVAAYLAGGAPAAGTARAVVTAAELARRWETLPHLTRDEAAAFARDLAAARRDLPELRRPAWD
jgi:hypothetical protein